MEVGSSHNHYRAVLRIGAVEMLFVETVPPKVAIQEAILLAEMYGGEESPRFVNGVLDALFKGVATGLIKVMD